MAETAETLRLPRKPEARTEKVEDLVDKVVRGLHPLAAGR